MNNNGMNYTNDLNDENNYSSKKILTTYKVGLLLISIFAICLMVTFGINAYHISQIDPFEKEGSTLPADYLLDSSRTYFDYDATRLPSAVGQCINVTLDTIKKENLISDIKYYNKCDANNTYVRVCKLESGDYHFEVSMSCNDKVTLAVGNKQPLSDESVVADNMSAQISFDYMAQKLDSSNVEFGEPVTMWSDEIQYTNYKIIKETTYYRYRTKLWQWSGDVKKYYPYNLVDDEKVIEYYKESPNSSYQFKEVSQNYAYKWYIQNDNGPKYYYPSGSTNESEETTYYLVAPVIGAKKELSTKTYAAKYYNVSNETISDFYSIAPSNNAKKLLETETWSNWSDYSLAIPSFNENEINEVEKRVKVDIVPILNGTINENSWSNISNGYLTEDELISQLRVIGYDVSSISDVFALKDIKYQVKQSYQETKVS